MLGGQLPNYAQNLVFLKNPIQRRSLGDRDEKQNARQPTRPTLYFRVEDPRIGNRGRDFTGQNRPA